MIRKPSDPVVHGTNAGYAWHMSYDRPACPACKEAHRKATKERRARLVSCKDCGRVRPIGSRGRCQTCYIRYMCTVKGRQWQSRHNEHQRAWRAKRKADQADGTLGDEPAAEA